MINRNRDIDLKREPNSHVQSKRMFRVHHSSATLNKSSVGLKAAPQSKSPQRNTSFNVQPIDINEFSRIVKPSTSTKKLKNFLQSNVQSPLTISPASTKLPLKTPASLTTTQGIWSTKVKKAPDVFRQTKLSLISHSHNVSAYEFSSPAIDFNSREESLVSSSGDLEHDFTNEAFLTRLMSSFKAAPGCSPTHTIYFGRISRQVSIKQAQLVVESLVDCLRFIKHVRLGEIQKGLRRHHGISDDLDDNPENKVEEFTNAINECIDICKRALETRFSRKSVEEYAKRMVEITLKTANPGLVLYSVFIQGRLCIARCSFRSAINVFKNFKDLCLKYDLFPRCMEAYKMLGRCYQAINLHKTSLIYFTKFLYMAWMRDSPRHELLAYDYIGLQYYYLGNLDKADYFHARMMGGKHEPKDSRLRKIGITKMKINKVLKRSDQTNEFYLYDFENEFDIDIEMDKVTKKLDKDDEGDEVSYRDEGFEPPLFNTEDEPEDHRKEISVFKPDNFEIFNRKATLRSPVKLKAIPGFVKAKVALSKKTEEKQKKKPAVSLQNSPDNSFVLTESKSSANIYVRPITTLLFTSKPNQQIFTSHLSRNRGLKNFSLAGAFNSSYNENNDATDELDSKSCELIKRILEKMKINLEVIRDCLIKSRQKAS